MKKSALSTLAALGGATIIGHVTQAQTSELFLNDWSDGQCYVVQNGAVVRSFARAGSQDGPGLVVQDTIKNIGQDPGGIGYEYDLNGNQLSGTYENPAALSFDSLYDGATDGVNNWSIAHNDFDSNFAVVQGDADWQNLQILFVPARRSSGIAYDATDNTLWITNNVGGVDRVQHFDLAGGLLGEFAAVHSGGGYGIALDPADDTLWIPGSFGTSGQLFQYDKSGNLLQTIAPTGLGATILGAEFQAGPGNCLSLTNTGYIGGQPTTWTISNGTPGQKGVVVYGFNAGSINLNNYSASGRFWCAEIGIAGVNPSKIVGNPKVLDANGEATWTKTMPLNQVGNTILTQALGSDTCPDDCHSSVDSTTVQ